MIDAVADIRVPAILLVGCMYVISALCMLGLICKNYHDNWPQTVGLGAIIIWALGRASSLGERENLTLDQVLAVSAWDTLSKTDTVSAYQLIGASGMVLFGIGTAWKVWKHRHSDKNPNGTV